ncbi:MAG: ATP-binding protein [Polyangiaceae bacterium]
MTAPHPLAADQLCCECDPRRLPFTSTHDLSPLHGPFGQERAAQATRFALSMARDGYNLFVSGPAGHGKHAFVQHELSALARTREAADDWCYVRDFSNETGAKALRLPAGMARKFAQDLEKLVEDLRVAIPAALDSESHRARLEQIREELEARPQAVFRKVEEDAKAFDVAMLRVPSGVGFAPLKDGSVLDPEAFEKLPRQEQERIEANIRRLQEKLARELRPMPKWAKEARERAKALAREVVAQTVDQAIEEVKEAWAVSAQVTAHLSAMRNDIVENAQRFSEKPEQESPLAIEPVRVFDRYRVNVLVDNAEVHGAPVVYENKPNLQRLLGRVEHRAQLGTLISDFTLIRPGALHRANGGYLVLDALDVLTNPQTWAALKRALYDRQVQIESLAQAVGLGSGESLEPEPIPLQVKVVLVGERQLYHLMAEHDADMPELFKVLADFEDVVDRGENSELEFGRQVAAVEQRDGLRSFHAGAVARLIEQSSRAVADRRKLSTATRDLVDLCHQADSFAAKREAAVVEQQDVVQAIHARRRRHDRLSERFREQILQRTVLVDTTGSAVGQINGLSVLEFGGARFGLPTRITATARVGDGKVVDIEREVELGGVLHSKGVLILSSYFASHYTRQVPLSLAASLVFEQSYFGVEGDSASMAELLALISALARVPLRQSLAVTGSVSQHGQAQAIGGVNEKIEGFFDVCVARGLTGDQGVIIPASNIDNLVLREDVVQAVRDAKFAVYAVTTVDEALELLTGESAGVADEDGQFPEGTINARVLDQLVEFAIVAEGFSRFVQFETQGEPTEGAGADGAKGANGGKGKSTRTKKRKGNSGKNGRGKRRDGRA